MRAQCPDVLGPRGHSGPHALRPLARSAGRRCPHLVRLALGRLDDPAISLPKLPEQKQNSSLSPRDAGALGGLRLPAAKAEASSASDRIMRGARQLGPPWALLYSPGLGSGQPALQPPCAFTRASPAPLIPELWLLILRDCPLVPQSQMRTPKTRLVCYGESCGSCSTDCLVRSRQWLLTGTFVAD